jgi:hypothetical protein
MENKEKFLKIYANLPLGLRSEIVVVLDNEPLTWNSAYIEVVNDTLKGKEILEKLVEIEIIKNDK